MMKLGCVFSPTCYVRVLPLLLLALTLITVHSITRTHALGLQLFVPNTINSATPSASFQIHAYSCRGPEQFFINASLVNLVPGQNRYACDPLNITLVASSVVLSLLGRCSLESKIRQCQYAHCLGVIIREEYASAGLSRYTVYDGSEKDGDLVVPLTAISKTDNTFIQGIFQEHHTDRLSCVLQSETNPWTTMFTSVWWYIVPYGVLLPLNMWGIQISGVKILLFIRKKAWKTQVFAALWLELLANLQRAVYLAVELLN